MNNKEHHSSKPKENDDYSLRWEYLKKKPKMFKRSVGVDLATFKEMVADMQKRHYLFSKSRTKKKPGAKGKFSLEDIIIAN